MRASLPVRELQLEVEAASAAGVRRRWHSLRLAGCSATGSAVTLPVPVPGAASGNASTGPGSASDSASLAYNLN